MRDRNTGSNENSSIEEAESQLVTELLDTESEHKLELIERKLRVIRRLKE